MHTLILYFPLETASLKLLGFFFFLLYPEHGGRERGVHVVSVCHMNPPPFPEKSVLC